MNLKTHFRFRRTLTALAGLAVCIGAARGASAPAAIEQTNYRGWKACKLSNGLITLYVTPEIGGRIIQFELAGHPFLFLNPELAGKVFPPEENGGGKGGWKNYGGSKLWPAPQGWARDDQWPGPPDPVLDGGIYQSEIVERGPERAAVKVTSPPDPRTGVQLSRTISLEPGGTQVHHDCVMRNISRRPVRWSIWEVVQHDAADPEDPAKFNDDLCAYCPLNPQSLHPKGFVPLYGQVTHPSWQPDYDTGLMAVKYDYRVGKVGLDSKAGWLAVANGRSDYCFVSKFNWFPNAPYPDNASVEFWLNGAGEFILNGVAFTNAPDRLETPYLMEAEVLSPLVELQPGQEYHFQIDWFATRCPRPIVDVTSAGAVHQRLRLSATPDRARLEGVFGVFYPGRAEATITDAVGNVLARRDLGRAGPATVFRLDQELPLPQAAARISVSLLDTDGRNRGWLGNVPVLRNARRWPPSQGQPLK
jgi:Domain of unknown function (DUF4380)